MGYRTVYATLTTAELLLEFATKNAPSDLEVAMAEKIEELCLRLEDYEAEPVPATEYVDVDT